MDRPLRFCMVSTFYPPYHFGGDAVFIYRLAEALAERGHSVDVIHSIDAYRLQHPGEPEVTFSHHAKVKRHALETTRPRLSSLTAHQLGGPAVYRSRLRALLDGGEYDVIHFHNISLMGGPRVLRLGRAVKLYTAHEYWLVCPTHVLFRFKEEACVKKKCLRCQLVYRRPPQLWRYTAMVHRCLREIDLLLAPSRFTMDRLRADGLDCPMTVLPHFVPSATATASTKDEPNSGRPYFLVVGRLEKLKGIQDLIHLFANYRAADLVVVGDGDYGAVLREQARGLEHVRFVGSVHASHVADLYRGAIAVLAASLCYETFGLSVAEALAHGTPVIARRIGALAEIVEQNGGGFLFDSLDQCCEAMERVRTNAQLRDDLAARGRAAAQNWTADIHLARYLDLGRSLIEQRASRPDAGREQKSGAGGGIAASL